MAKKKSGVNFKQILLQKGERYGFYAAGALLLLFLFLGVFKAATSASTGSIVNDFNTKIQSVEHKINHPGDQAKPIDPVVYGTSTVAQIPFVRYPATNPLFNETVNEQTKRLNPHLYPLTEAQVDFVRGSINVYNIYVDPSGERMIAVITERAKTQNNIKPPPKRVREGANRPRPATAPQPAPAPQAPGAVGPGRRPIPGIGGMQNAKSTEPTVEYKKTSDPDIGQATFAQNIEPRRMVVVTGSIPYKAQVEEYRRALRAKDANSLSEYPEYRGFVVERRMLSLDGKTVEHDWAVLDIQGSLIDLFHRVVEFEPENPPREMDQKLQALYPRVVPDESNELLVPRPKLYQGDYPPVTLPSVTEALTKLADSGQGTAEIRTQTQQQLDDENIFHQDRSERQQNNNGGLAGRLGGGPGGSRLPPGMRTVIPPAAGPGANNRPQRAEDEDAWIMRFIDVTAEPGHAYQYRVSLKALNPNYHKPANELAMPSLAEKEMLQSDPFEINKLVIVPPEEYLYAATKDDAKNRLTERMPSPSNWDQTWVQMQRWYAYIRLVELPPPPVPFGEWLVADLKAFRGQYVGETMLVRLPVWSMAKGMFLFRDNPRRAAASSGIYVNQKPKSEPTWKLDLAPQPQVLLVDFEGGSGKYVGPKNHMVDDNSAGVEMLFLTADGKLKVARSGHDLNDADRAKREDNWNKWLDRVAADTAADKGRGDGTGGGNDLPRGR